MKVREVRTYQSIRLAGSLGEINFINIDQKTQKHFSMEVRPNLGVQISYNYNASSGNPAVDTIIVPFTNVAYFKELVEEKAEVKEAKPRAK